MRVYLEKDEPRVLPIPYWTAGEPGRRFWNVKKNASLASRIRELRGCPELRAFVVAVNGEESRFATLGCDHWTKVIEGKRATSVRGPVSYEAGLYVDLVFDRIEIAAKKTNLSAFVRRLKALSRSGAGKPTSVIRVQPQRVHFRFPPRPGTGVQPDTVWMLSVWVFGSGASPFVAAGRRRRGLARLLGVCVAMSREVERRFGRGGTPVPP